MKVVIIFIVIILVVAAGAYFLGFKQGAKKGLEAATGAYQELMGKAGSISPTENLPSANPFEAVKVNPFEGIKINPFK